VSATHPVHTGAQVLERLPTLPGGPELLAQARRREDVALVGGAVRDLLLGHWPRELDVTVAADAERLARDLAASVSPSERAYGHAVTPTLYERFGTASVAWEYGRIDIAERRAESYAAPGALPEVRPGSMEEDLARRDFTVNAIALPLARAGKGRLHCVDGALEDLAAGTLRVLHERSFLEDPTRILRLARYAARLRFEVEPRTRELALAAVASGALRTLSGGRIGAELWLAAREQSGIAVFTILDELGALAALGMPSPFDATLAREAQALLPADGAPEVVLLGVAFRRRNDDDRGAEPALATQRLLDALEFTREQADAVAEVADRPTSVAALLARSGEGVYAALDEGSLETAAVVGALAAQASAQAAASAREWLTTMRHVKLEIDGNVLLAAGLSEGPEIGVRLRSALETKREGRAGDREAELRAALAANIERGGGQSS
jgi:tRNA nucleotidyltransferase (CCA-adding enzyme)